MISKKVAIIAFTISITQNSFANFITYKLIPGSRLGDHLLTYTIATLVADLSDLPLHGPMFKWADHLALSTHSLSLPSKKKRTVSLKEYKNDTLPDISKNNISHKANNHAKKNTASSNNTKKIPIATSNNTNKVPIAYECTLKTIINDMKGFQDLYTYTQQNPAFKNKLSRLICPLKPLEYTPLPHDMITVAVHVRKGGGFDKPLFMHSDLTEKPKSTHHFADQMYPKRFPPETYYIEQIATIAHLYNNQPLFVHIFTDDPQPSAIAERFNIKLSHLPITFSYRTEGNFHDANVLEDLFDMMRFDCLIRPASSYSKMAQLLGNHKIIIYPKRVHWIGNELIADKIGIINNRATE